MRNNSLKALFYASLMAVSLTAFPFSFGCGSSGGPGTDNNPPPPPPPPPPPITECVPSKSSTPISDTCGIFVAKAGSDNGPGTKSQPFATLGKAIDAASTSRKPIYLCAETFEGQVAIPAGTTIYGGVDCNSGWLYVGATQKSILTAKADQIPVKFIKGGGQKAHVEDLQIQAADSQILSGSSIAAIAHQTEVEFVRCSLIAGNAQAGESGVTPQPTVPQDPNDQAIKGNDGNSACQGGGGGNIGADPKANTLFPASIGGGGGSGLEPTGNNGQDGSPFPMPNPNSYGTGGVGATAMAPCTNGSTGVQGAEGLAGLGAQEVENGLVDLTGYKGVSGQNGSSGEVGQGGGGGGAAAGKPNCYGASGGSGGAGGGGGLGGLGGQYGGSSIALISLDSILHFQDTQLISSQGGKGGDGAQGGLGGAGGLGGIGGAGATGLMPTLPGCNGGSGGPGGNGGAGGGGRGGHSVGIAFIGASPATDGLLITTGSAGEGGGSAEQNSVGAIGKKADLLQF